MSSSLVRIKGQALLHARVKLFISTSFSLPLVSFVLNSFYIDDIVANVHNKVFKANKNAASVLPKTFAQLENIILKAPSLTSRGIAMRLAREIGTTPRSVDWIRQNGICVHNIVAKQSKLPHAGQGAVAQRFMGEGDVIVPAPMLHIVDKEVLRMHGDHDDDDDNPVKPYQLLLNYCFGHNQSSLLLCPVTNAMLVNHCSNRRKGECGKNGPNAEYRWASGWDHGKTEVWLNKTLEELAQESARGLSMEIVATRDIQEGEEVHIDYGRGWEEAWDKHVATWKPPDDDLFEAYVSPTEMNARMGPLEKLVSGDLRKIAKHSNLFTGCIFWMSGFDDEDERWESKDPNWESLDNQTILERYSSSDGSSYFGDYEEQFDGSYWPCAVVGSEDGSTYTVRILQSLLHSETKWHEQDLPRFITNFPRESIRYFNKPYTSDLHLLNAFRHPIEIRDDIFPEQWKDLK